MEKKKVLTAVAVGAATVAAGVGANQAKADSVKVTKQVIGDETKITTTTTKTVDSQEQINQTKQKVSDQKKVTDQASSTVDKDSQQVSQDKSNVAHWESVKKDATPANISANKQAQASQQSKISADKSIISSQQKNVDSAQSSVNSAQSNLNDKKAEQSSAQTNYNNAQNDYNKAKQNADNIQSAISDQQSTVSKDKQNISADNSQISGLNNSIANDKTAISDTQSAINNVSQKAQDDQAKLSRDENSLSDAQSQKTNNENKEQQAQDALNNVWNPASVLPNVPQWYINDDKNADNDPGKAWSYLNNVNDPSVHAKLMEELNEYNKLMNLMDNQGEYNLPNTAVFNQMVTPNNLTNEQLKILNEYTLMALNDLRAQAGLPPLELSQGCINAANVLHNDSKVNMNTVDSQGLSDLSEIYSNPMTNSRGGNVYLYKQISMANLIKDSVYNMFVQFTQGDGHSAELMFSGNGYFGMSIIPGGLNGGDPGVAYTYVTSTGTTSDSNNLYNCHNLSGEEQYSNDNIIPLPDVSQLQSDLANAKQKVADDDTAIQQLRNAVNADKAQLAQDTPSGLENQLSQQKAKLAQDTQSLQDAQNRLSMDEQKLTQDENTLSQLQQEANDPQKVLDTLANKVATAKTALDNANNAVAQAQQAYDTAEANLQKQQQILSNDEAQLAKDEATLKNLQQQAQDYQNADQNLANAQKQLAADLAKYNQDHQTYLDDLQVLNELETELLNEEKTYTTTSVQWVKNLHPTTTSEIGNQYVLNSRSGNSTVKFGSMDEVQAAEVPGLRRSNRNNGLPDTGDNQNSAATVVGLLGLGLAGVLSMFGLAERKKDHD